MAALLAIEGLGVQLGRQQVLEDVWLEVAAGETVALVGASGSGKTSLLRACLGLLPPAAQLRGGLRFNSPRFTGAWPGAGAAQWRQLRRRHVAWIPQEPATALDPRRSAAAHLRECLARGAGGSRGRGQAAAHQLEEVGLPAEQMAAYPHQWSGGMQQRLLVAMALARQPELLLADEPSSALDPLHQRQLLDLLARRRREQGFALLLVTHDLAVAAELAERVVVLEAGRVVEQGSAGAVLRHPAHAATAALVAAQPAWPAAAQGAGA